MMILSDFDGVITDQREEGMRVHELYKQRIIEDASIHTETYENIFKRCQSIINSAITDYGWISEGRITAFCDEDYFIQNIGIANCMDKLLKNKDAEITSLFKSLQKNNIQNFTDIASWAYAQMVIETKKGKLKPLNPNTKDIFETLLSQGHKIVIVSNSSTDRIIQLLQESHINAVEHTDNKDAPLRVRGNARKFELGVKPKSILLNNHLCDVNRPFYETILKEEIPQYVIGDVFSLDLALPLYLTYCLPEFKNTQLILHEQPYTPDWIKNYIHSHEHKNIQIIQDLKSLKKYLYSI